MSTEASVDEFVRYKEVLDEGECYDSFDYLQDFLDERGLTYDSSEAYMAALLSNVGGSLEVVEAAFDQGIRSIQDVEEYLEDGDAEDLGLSDYSEPNRHAKGFMLPEILENLGDLTYNGHPVDSFPDFFERVQAHSETYDERLQQRRPTDERPLDMALKSLKQVIPDKNGGGSPRLHSFDFLEAVVRGLEHEFLIPDRDSPPTLKPIYVDTEAPKKALKELAQDEGWATHREGDNAYSYNAWEALQRLETRLREEGWDSERVIFDGETLLCKSKHEFIDS